MQVATKTLPRITSTANPLVHELIEIRDRSRRRRRQQQQQQQQQQRQPDDLVLVEGSKLVQEIGGRTALDTVVVTTDRHLDQVLQWQDERRILAPRRIVRVHERVMAKVSSQATPDGIVATTMAPIQQPLNKQERVLVLDRLNDPGNVGTLVRTAAALGWNGVFMVRPCADPLNAKAIAASRGSILTMPYDMGSIGQLQALAHQRQVWLAMPASGPGPASDRLGGDKSAGTLLVLGSESHGIHPDLATLGKRIQIPMSDSFHVGSLNVAVAGGILMYSLT